MSHGVGRTAPQGKQLVLLSVVVVALAAVVTRTVVQRTPGSSVETAEFEVPLVQPNPDAQWEALLAGGDAAAGERLFFGPDSTVRCGACHKFRGRGETSAPSLTKIGRVPMEQLIDNIVNPARVLTAGFETVTVFTTNGRVIQGRSHELNHAQKVSVRLGDGRIVEIPRSDIEKEGLRFTTAMPTNLAEELSLQDLRDLIALFRSEVPKPANPGLEKQD